MTNHKPVPTEGCYFGRNDVMGARHDRTYFRDGAQISEIVGVPDPERPGKWQVSIRWRRRDKWHAHGWGPLDSEQDALAIMDAVSIGFEASTGGCTFLGNL